MLLLWIDNKTLFMNDGSFLMTDCEKEASKEYSTAVLSTLIIKNGNKGEPLQSTTITQND
jgi:hypothetical protein